MAAKRRRKRSPRTEPDENLGPEAQRRDEQVEAISNSRGRELCDEKEIKDALLELYKDILKGFEDQGERSDDLMDYWDAYNGKLGPRQAYAGNSKIFVPIMRNAVNARKVRFTNQIFPQTGRYVECTTSEEKPNDIISLLEHYVRTSKLRTRVMPALMKNGDLEGQYTVYVSWEERKRRVVHKVLKPLKGENGIAQPGTEDEDIEEQEITRAGPNIEVISDADVCVIPATADSIDQALAAGGAVTIIRRWSKAQIKAKIATKEIDEAAGEALLEELKEASKSVDGQKDPQRAHVDAAGIKTSAGRTFALVYETYTMLTYDGERDLYKAFFGGEQKVLGCKRNPYWCDRVPIFSTPLDKVGGSFKGIPLAKSCIDMQVAANDAINEGMDSATYSMLPIIMTDPLKNPRIGTMMLNLAAIWETNPNDTQFAKFPELWKSAFEMVNAYKTEIFQTLSVSPAIMPQSSGMKTRRNQAEIAQEQQVDIIATADAVTVLEGEILSPLLGFILELDHQFRDKAMTVRQYGTMGMRANMQEIAPIQMNHRYEFRWFGVEAARNAQQIQQQIAALNVMRGIPPQQYAPYQLNVRPVLSQLIENVFGPRLSPEIFQDPRSQLSQNPEIENGMLMDGFEVPVHPLDDDAQHLKLHQQLLQMGDPTGQVRVHMQKHLMQLSMKTQAQAAQGGQGMPGVPGGAGAGVAGTPRMGAQPGGVRNGQGPPGMIHQDRMQGPGIAPRR